MTQLEASLKIKLLDEVSATARAIEDRMRGIGATTDAAAAEAAQALEMMRLGEVRAAAEAQRLAGEVRRLQAAGGASAEKIEELQRAMVRARRGAAEYAAEARRLAQAQTQAGAASARADAAVAQSSDAVAAAAKAKTRGMAEAVNMASEMALGFGGLSPTVREFGIALAMGGNNAVTMANSFGPLGIVLGVATGLLPQLITYLSRSSAGMDELASNADRARQTFTDLLDAIRAVREEGERENRLARGEGTVEEQRDALEATQQRLREAQRQQRTAQERFERALPRDARARSQVQAVLSTLEGTEGFEAMSGAAQVELQARLVGEQVRQAGGGEAMARALMQQVRQAREARREVTQSDAAVRQQQRLVSEAEAALATAQTREREEQAEEARRERDRRAGAAQQELEDVLELRAVRPRDRARLLESAQRGRALTAADRQLLGPEAERFERAARTARGLRRAAAADRLARSGDDVTFEEEEIASAAPADPVVARARRRVRAAVRPAPAPAPEREDTSALARFAEEIDRARLRIVVEDRRVTATVEGARGGRSRLEVDASASDPLGGQ